MHYTLRHTTWHKNKNQLAQIRRKVFIEEQNVPEELEWDEDDATAHHILICDANNQPIATGRIKPDGHIGRLAVIKNWRHRGVGSAVLKALIQYAHEHNMQHVHLHAQTSAIAFYEKHNFSVCSEEFIDAGIPHKTMHQCLQTTKTKSDQ